MGSTRQCLCCLLRPSAKDLQTPYSRLGITETYLLMIQECFAMKLTLCKNGRSGICMVCLERLREACRFKMQIRQCQVKLQAMRELDLRLKDADVILLSDDDLPCDLVSSSEEISALPEVDRSSEPTASTATTRVEAPTLPEVANSSDPTSTTRVEASALPEVAKSSDPTTTTHQDISMKSDIDGDWLTGMTSDDDENWLADMMSDDDEDLTAGIKDIWDKIAGMKSNVNEDMTTDITSNIAKNRTSDVIEVATSGATSDFNEERTAGATSDVNQDWAAGTTSDVNEVRTAGATSDVNEARTAGATSDVDKDRSAVIKSDVDSWAAAKSNRGDNTAADVVVNITRMKEDNEERLEISKISVEFMVEEESISPSPTGASGANTALDVSRTRQQLTSGCSVRLKRLHSDEAPLATQSYHATSQHEPKRAISLEDMPVNAAPAGAGKQTYTCDWCSKQFMLKSRLVRHIRRHTDSQSYVCEVCNKTFVNSIALNKHLRLHSVEAIRPFVHKNNLDIHKNKPYKCNKCIKRFSTKSHRQTHEITCEGTLYKCKQCKEQFLGRRFLNFHKKNRCPKLKQEEKQQYSCHECNQHFGEKYGLDIHMQTHIEEKPHICKQCKNQFKSEPELARHERIHSGDQSYECEICESVFFDEISLTQHFEIHKARRQSILVSELAGHERIDSGDKSYECEICESVFFDEISLTQHFEIHKARRQSILVSELAGHERIDSGDKSYECEICESVFFDEISLTQHLETHRAKKQLVNDIFTRNEI